MKRLLAILAGLLVVALAIAAEVRQETLPKDRMPVAEASFAAKDWWERTEIPLDHPYWWTLTDEVSPADLQRRLQHRAVELQLEAAAKLRRAAAAQSSEEPRQVTAWIVDGSETPELFPVWSVLEGFGAVVVGRDELVAKERELLEFGLHPSAVAHVLGAAVEAAEKQTELWQETYRAQQKLLVLLQSVERTQGADERRRLLERDDFAALAAATDTPVEELTNLARLSNRDTAAEATIPLMVSLRAQIGEEQWNLLRRYLLLKVAPYRSESVIFRPND